MGSSLSLIMTVFVANTVGLECLSLRKEISKLKAALNFNIFHLFLSSFQIRTGIRNPWKSVTRSSFLTNSQGQDVEKRSPFLTLTTTIFPFTISSIHSLVHPSVLPAQNLSTY